MPLSEDEKRILSEIETQLRETDPDLADQVSKTTVYRDAFGKLRWAIVAFVLCLAASVLLLSVNYLLAFARLPRHVRYSPLHRTQPASCRARRNAGSHRGHAAKQLA